MSFRVGQVIHYYANTGIAVVQVEGSVGVGDRLRFAKNGKDLHIQVVDHIQSGHEKVSFAQSGEVVGIKLSKEVADEAEVYKEQ